MRIDSSGSNQGAEHFLICDNALRDCGRSSVSGQSASGEDRGNNDFEFGLFHNNSPSFVLSQQPDEDESGEGVNESLSPDKPEGGAQ